MDLGVFSFRCLIRLYARGMATPPENEKKLKDTSMLWPPDIHDVFR